MTSIEALTDESKAAILADIMDQGRLLAGVDYGR